MRELALFAGAGGGILGGKLLGWTCMCGVELNPYPAGVLISRQNEGILRPFPVWDDVSTFDGHPWRGHIDVVSGGFPCTDISVAGLGAGLEGSESKLWEHQARIIGDIRPQYAFVENSPALTFRGGVRVIADLTRLGYDCIWGIMGAEDAIWLAGTPVFDHERKRIWIIASRRQTTGDGEGDGLQERELPNRRESEEPLFSKSNSQATDPQGIGWRSGELRVGASQSITDAVFKNQDADSSGERCREEMGIRYRESTQRASSSNQAVAHTNSDRFRQMEPENDQGTVGSAFIGSPAESTGGWWSAEPNVDRMVYGLPNRVDRIAAIGMAQVPAVVRLAWETLTSLHP